MVTLIRVTRPQPRAAPDLSRSATENERGGRGSTAALVRTNGMNRLRARLAIVESDNLRRYRLVVDIRPRTAALDLPLHRSVATRGLRALERYGYHRLGGAGNDLGGLEAHQTRRARLRARLRPALVIAGGAATGSIAAAIGARVACDPISPGTGLLRCR